MKKRLDLQFIVARRKGLGLKQDDVAKRMGMSGAPAYNKYEKGVYQIKANMLPVLAEILVCPIDKFFCADD